MGATGRLQAKLQPLAILIDEIFVEIEEEPPSRIRKGLDRGGIVAAVLVNATLAR